MSTIAISRASTSVRFMDRLKRVRDVARATPKFATLILLGVVTCAVFAPLLASYDPTKNNILETRRPPVWQSGGSSKHLLGTDGQGRDVLSRLIYGSRVSLAIGLIVTVAAGGIGTVVALVAGYTGGWVDALLMRITDGVFALPFILVAIVLGAALGPSLQNMIIVLLVVGWASYARILRGEVLRAKENDYVRSAEVTGASRLRILFIHLFPSIFNTLMVLASLNVGRVVLAEASLSFLGLGVQPPQPAWGLMLSDGRGYLNTFWWLAVLPGIALVLTVYAVNALGDWLRDRLDPLRRQV